MTRGIGLVVVQEARPPTSFLVLSNAIFGEDGQTIDTISLSTIEKKEEFQPLHVYLLHTLHPCMYYNFPSPDFVNDVAKLLHTHKVI